MGGERPKVASPPTIEEMEPYPEPSPAPMPVVAQVTGEAKKAVRKRAKKARGRESTILANRMMQTRNDIGILRL